MVGKPHEPHPAARPGLSPLEPGESIILPGTRPQAGELGPAHDLSSLLYSLLIRPWTSLAIVSPDDGDRSWRLAQKLAEAAQQSHYPSLRAVDLLDLNPERASAIAHAVSKVTALGERKRFVIAIASPAENPIAIRVLGACEAALLVLQRGRSRIPDAQRTVELVGRDRLIGAVLCSR
jgi:hypothetical protein